MDLLQPTGDAHADVAALRSWWEESQPRHLVIETSGSTGTAKRVLLSRDAVLASVEASARRVGTGTWVLALPSSYVAGVQVICRSLHAGREPVLADDHPSLAASIAAAGEAACVSLVPTQLHRALADPDTTAALGTARMVLLGGGPIDPALRARAAGAGVPIVATYGASETAGGCVYDGHPLDGVGVIVGADGRIRLGGPTIFTGYLDDPGLTEQSLVDGWYVTSDAGRLDEDGRLQVVGRLDDVVISGGVKVSLPAVAARLRGHPHVEAAECVGVADREWGTRVVACVVLTATGADSGGTGADSGGTGANSAGLGVTAELRDWVAQVHPRSWAPREVRTILALPLLANGKVDRRALEVLAGG